MGAEDKRNNNQGHLCGEKEKEKRATCVDIAYFLFLEIIWAQALLLEFKFALSLIYYRSYLSFLESFTATLPGSRDLL